MNIVPGGRALVQPVVTINTVNTIYICVLDQNATKTFQIPNPCGIFVCMLMCVHRLEKCVLETKQWLEFKIKDCQPCSVGLRKSLYLVGEAICLCPQPQQEKDRCIQ